MTREAGQGLLFCEQKRSKKNFINLDRAGENPVAQINKSFLVTFFQKSNCFFLTSLKPIKLK
jgi:hypothetical protein